MKIFKKRVLLLGLILLWGAVFLMGRPIVLNHAAQAKVTADIQCPTDFKFQVYYIPEGEAEFSEDYSARVDAKGNVSYQTLTLTLPTRVIRGLRLDIDTDATAPTGLKNIVLSSWFYTQPIGHYLFTFALENGSYHQFEPLLLSDGSMVLKNPGEDAHILAYFDFAAMQAQDRQRVLLVWVGLSAAMSAFGMLVLWRFRYVLLETAQALYKEKWLLWQMAVQDFQKKYVGSYFGIVWAFVQPLITVMVFWFVFQVGFRASPVSDAPFVLWLVSGLIPWFYFSDAWNSATYSLQEYSYLVKKMMFPTFILPPIRILSALFVHVVFYFLLVFVALLYGFTPTWHIFQLFYYTLCCTVLVAGLSYFSAAVIVFFKDLGNVISIILQVGMWITPIMWSHTTLSGKLLLICRMNPMFYIVQGFRDAMFQHVWFFERSTDTAFFAVICTALFLGGAAIFKRLRPHFSDVL